MKTIHHVVDIDAEPEQVWASLTDPPRLAQWWSTKLDVTGPASLGARLNWTFAGDFNPVMEITALDDGVALTWLCRAGHGPWQDNTFRFELVPLDGSRTRLRFWQDYAVELDDDAYGTYNFNWGYYLESLRKLCVDGAATPFVPG